MVAVIIHACQLHTVVYSTIAISTTNIIMITINKCYYSAVWF